MRPIRVGVGRPCTWPPSRSAETESSGRLRARRFHPPRDDNRAWSGRECNAMRLSPREVDKLLLHNAGFLAQKRLARGVRLNYPESVALIATQLLEFIREGRTVADLMDLGRQFLGRRQVMAGVPAMVGEVQVEGTFPDGTKLVTVH